MRLVRYLVRYSVNHPFLALDQTEGGNKVVMMAVGTIITVENRLSRSWVRANWNSGTGVVLSADVRQHCSIVKKRRKAKAR